MMAGWRYHRPDHHQDIVPDRVAVLELQTKVPEDYEKAPTRAFSWLKVY